MPDDFISTLASSPLSMLGMTLAGMVDPTGTLAPLSTALAPQLASYAAGALGGGEGAANVARIAATLGTPEMYRKLRPGVKSPMMNAGTMAGQVLGPGFDSVYYPTVSQGKMNRAVEPGEYKSAAARPDTDGTGWTFDEKPWGKVLEELGATLKVPGGERAGSKPVTSEYLAKQAAGDKYFDFYSDTLGGTDPYRIKFDNKMGPKISMVVKNLKGEEDLIGLPPSSQGVMRSILENNKIIDKMSKKFNPGISFFG